MGAAKGNKKVVDEGLVNAESQAMRIKLKGKILSDTLAKTNPASVHSVGHASQMFQNVKIDALPTTGLIDITTASPACQVRQRLPEGEVEKPGSILISRDKLQQLAREAGSGTVDIRDAGSQVQISVAGTTFRLHKLEGELPETQAVEDAESFFLKGEEIKRLLKHTLPFADKNQDRLYLNGILLEKLPEETRAVATDGHRLSLFTLPFAGKGNGQARKVTIPNKIAQLVLNLASDENDVEIKIGTDVLEISEPDYCIRAPLMHGEFPDYRNVIPKSVPHVARVNRGSLLETLRRIRVVADQVHRGVLLSFDKAELKLKGENPNIGEAAEAITAEAAKEIPPVGIDMNYLICATEVVDDPDIIVGVTNDISPVKITGASENPLILIMPMRI
jgi:DNA polymerase-3 subunit beta